MKYILIITSFIFSLNAYADGKDGFGQIFNMFFGNEAERSQVASCTAVDGKGGIMGVVNGFFCHMEKDMGIVGVTAGVTKVMGAMSVRAVVATSTAVVDGVAYDYNAQVWVCHSACTVASNFNRAINFYFSYVSDKTINKGHMLMNPNAFEAGGSATSAMNLKYDVGTSTTNKSITAKVIFVQGATAANPTPITMRMRMDGSKAGSLMGVTGIMDDGSRQFRFASQLDTVSNAGGVYFEVPGAVGQGAAAPNLTLAGDDKSSSSMCFTRVAAGDDWTYSAGTGSCAVKIFPPESVNNVSAYGATGVLTIGTLWESMSANPSSI